MLDVIFEERSVSMVAIRITSEGAARRDKLLADGKCLGCQEVTEADEQMRRGLCEACYSAFRRALAKKLVQERKLIKDGRVLAPGKGGRRPANAFTKSLSEE
jgi:hypothetical protein